MGSGWEKGVKGDRRVGGRQGLLAAKKRGREEGETRRDVRRERDRRRGKEG